MEPGLRDREYDVVLVHSAHPPTLAGVMVRAAHSAMLGVAGPAQAQANATRPAPAEATAAFVTWPCYGWSVHQGKV